VFISGTTAMSPPLSIATRPPSLLIRPINILTPGDQALLGIILEVVVLKYNIMYHIDTVYR
jgi:hypothetical protein